MPRRTKAKKQTEKRALPYKSKEKKLFSWGDSYISFLLGIICIIIGILFIGSLIKANHTKEVTSTSTIAPLPSPSATPTPSPYTVQSGDDLWTIAEKVYKDGYKWVDIAQANNLANPSRIYKGDMLIIPTINQKNEQSVISNILLTQIPIEQKNTSESIKNTEYTVRPGDNLWNIAVRAYADGYKWVDIAQENNLANPGLIHAGNVLKIPR